MKREIVKKLRRGQELTVDEIDFVAEEFTNKRDYGLVWENHPEGVDLELKDGYFDIREVEKRKIFMNPGERNNLLIEGDNLHSLMALKEAGIKVDIIYIDPPYNTLNEEGFIFNDKIIDKEDSYRHSKWLSFMHKRLELARDLLSNDGLIFISIDDNEQANLKLLMDQVFGEENFITNFIYKKTGQQQNNGVNIAITHEYVICYAKELIGRDGKKKKILKGDNILNRKGVKQYKNKDKKGYYRLNPIQDKSLGKHSYTLIHPTSKKEVFSKYWRITKDSYEELLRANMIHWTENLPNVKKYLDPNMEVLINNYIDGFYNEQGDRDLKDILGLETRFNNPKNTDLLKYLFKRKGKNVVILDFFAGSGTTGQAVMELNKEDGGNRRFILCTNNENNICEEITYERNRRVILGEYAEGQVDPLPNNLSYYKVDIKNIDILSIDEKKELDLRKNIYSILWKNEYNVVEKNDKYLIVEKEKEKAAILLANTIDDNMRKAIEGSANCIYIPKHLSRDKILKMFCDKEVVYY